MYNPSPDFRKEHEERIARIDAIITEVFEKHPELDHVAYHNLYDPYQNANECCYQCIKAYGGCSWSRKFELPKGAIAYKSNRVKESYKIFYCPEFVQETGEMVAFDDEAAFRMLCAIAKVSADHYRGILEELVRLREKYELCSHNGEYIFNYYNLLTQKEQMEDMLEKHYKKIQKFEGFDNDCPYDDMVREKVEESAKRRRAGCAK